MAKTVIDLDDDALEQARAALGTRTKRDTVNQALLSVARDERRRRAWAAELDLVRSGAYDDLLDPEIMRGAWQ